MGQKKWWVKGFKIQIFNVSREKNSNFWPLFSYGGPVGGSCETRRGESSNFFLNFFSSTLLSVCLSLDFPLCSVESACEPGAFWHLLNPCGPDGRQRGIGDLGCELLDEYDFFGIIKGFECWSQSNEFSWDSQGSASAGVNFDAQLLLLSSLRQIRISVAFVSLALKT